MKRGEIWTVAGGYYAGKPRPCLIVQDDAFGRTASVTICIVTTYSREASLFRIVVLPDQRNGLRSVSHLMVDKITTVPRGKIDQHIGCLGQGDVARFEAAALLFLGFATGEQSDGC